MAAKRPDRSREAEGKPKRPDFRRGARPATPLPSVSTAAPGPTSPGRRIYFLALLALVTVTAVALLISFLMVQTPVPFLAVAVQYHDWPLAPNSFSEEDLEGFVTAFQDYNNVRFRRVAADGFSARWLTGHLNDLQPGGPRGIFRTRSGMIVYLSVHGAVDAAGNACLLLPGYRHADYLNSQTEGRGWLRVHEILQELRDNDKFRGVDKLLVLDVGKMELNWSIGWLHNSFATAVAKAARDANDPHLAILCATGDGERAWTDPSLGSSVFGFFFRQGLRGAADRDGNQKLTLRELDEYVRTRVADWVEREFGGDQRPVLIAADELNFPLAHAAPNDQPEIRPWKLDFDAPEIRSIWEKFARLSSPAAGPSRQGAAASRMQPVLPPWSHDGLGWARAQGQLVRYEQLLMAGAAYRDDAQDLQLELDKLLDESLGAGSDAGGRRTALPIGSLAALDAPDPAPSAAAFQAWEEFHRQPPAEGEAAKPLPKEAQVAYGPACWFAYDSARKDLVAGQADAWKQRAGLYLEFVEAQTGSVGAFLEPAELRLLRWGLSYLETPQQAARLKQAMEVRHRLEQATTVSDPRVAYWLQNRWDDLAASVRRNEDALFAQEPTAPEVERQWSTWLAPDGTGSISQLEQLGHEIAAAYQARDQARAWLPQLGFWLDCRGRAPTTLPGTAPTAELLRRWSEATELAHALDRELWRQIEQGPPQNDADYQAVRQLGVEVSAQVARLLDAYDEECDGLLRPGENPQWRALMDAALRVALPYADRQKLVVAFAARSDQPPDMDRAPREITSPANQPAAAEFVKQLQQQRHPAARLLLSDAEAADAGGTSGALDVAGEKLRQLLLGWDLEVQQAADRSYDELKAAILPDPLRARQGWNQADRLERLYAGLTWGDTSDLPTAAPGRVLHAFDQYVQTLRFAQRRLNDCWGPSPQMDEFFFVQACGKLFEKARDTLRLLPLKADSADGYQRALELVLRQRSTARLALEVTATAGPDETARRVEGQIAVRGAEDLPPGTAALFFQHGWPPQFVPVEINNAMELRHAVALNGTSNTDRLRFRLDPAPADPTLGPALFFRGRYDPQELTTGPQARPDVVAFRPEPRRPAKITVVGSAQETSYVMFVLDCSVSMRFPGRREGGNLDSKPPNRLQQAQGELPRIVETMCEDNPNVRPGLILFGHRLDEKSANADKDVETVLQFQGRRPGDATEMRKKFEKLVAEREATGVTPLYRSILEAMRQFPADSKPSQRTVIVLSDGADLTGYDHQKVLEGLRSRVDVFEYALTKEEKDDPRVGPARGRLKTICTQSGGTYHADLTSWFDAFRQSQKTSKQFTVAQLQDASARESAPLGGLVELNPGRLPGDFAIKVEGPELPVRLEGGERLELRNEGGELRFAPWPEVDERDPPLPRGGRLFRAAALDPLPYANGRLFRVALREYEPTGAGRPRFTPRPIGIWAEVEAATGEGQIVHPVTDLDFEPGHPGPVLRLPIPSWPPEARRALIRLWFASDVQPLRFVHDGPAPEDEIRHDGTTFLFRWDTSADRPRFIVTEKHPPQASEQEMYEYRVELKAPRSTNVEHRYYRASREVQHVFTLDAPPSGGLAESASVRITSKTEFIRMTLHEKPIVLDVPIR